MVVTFGTAKRVWVEGHPANFFVAVPKRTINRSKAIAITNTRGHKYKLFKPRCTSSLRQFFVVDRVVNVWNALPSTVNFSTLTAFRNNIDKVDLSAFL